MPVLLDLFCGGGGAAAGYAAAGFDVIGVDLDAQPDYPFPFVRADALRLPVDLGAVDAIHASPPCQAYSITRHTHTREHPDLVDPTRDALVQVDRPYVLENVPGAPLRDYVTLCGAAFGLEAADLDGSPLVLRRHRLFETSFFVWAPPPCRCAHYRARGVRIGGVYGGGSPTVAAARIRRGGYTPPSSVRADLIDAPHRMTQYGLAQSIPPAYTAWLGARLLEELAR